MKYRPVEWSPHAKAWVPARRRPCRFLSLFENALGLVLFVVGLVLFIALMHYLPDSAELAASMTRSIP